MRIKNVKVVETDTHKKAYERQREVNVSLRAENKKLREQLAICAEHTDLAPHEGCTCRLCMAIGKLTEAEANLANRKELVHRANDGQLQEVWYWQGDGFDDLESLTCPVFIQADSLRELLRAQVAEAEAKVDAEVPVVCLCGSTRFTEQMLIKQWQFTKLGYIVLSWCALPDSYFTGNDRSPGEDKTHIGDQEGVKAVVDEVHKRKIDLSDRVFVLNVGGYIGESTRSEIDYALAHGKPVEYLEELKP